MEQDALSAVISWIKESKKIVFLTGSELSLDLGIPDTGDLSFNPDIRLYKNNPDVRKDYWNKIKVYYPKILATAPSQAHEAIYEIELLYNVDSILTQCTDGLHAKAGSEKIFEIYSSISWVTCLDCGKDRKMDDVLVDIEDKDALPVCVQCGSDQVKPPISFPGQALPHWEIRESWIRLRGCDLFIIVGANLEIEPVASFPFQVMNEGSKVVIIGEAETPADNYVSAVINGKPSQVLPYILKKLKETTIVS